MRCEEPYLNKHDLADLAFLPGEQAQLQRASAACVETTGTAFGSMDVVVTISSSSSSSSSSTTTTSCILHVTCHDLQPALAMLLTCAASSCVSAPLPIAARVTR